VPDPETFSTSIPCRDAGGRLREFTIVSTGIGHIAVIVPPGESATIAPDQVGTVRQAFDDALDWTISEGHQT
jgi:hypothetical protein